MIAKIRNSKTYLPSPPRRTVETLKTLRQKNFGGLLILDSPRHARSFADFRKLKWVLIGQILNNVHAQKKTAPEVPCGLNSVEKYFREVGSFSGVIRVHVVIFFHKYNEKDDECKKKKVTESSRYFKTSLSYLI